MESKWRWNVFEMGLSRYGLRFCARILGQTNLYIAGKDRTYKKGGNLVYLHPDTDFGWSLDRYQAFSLTDRFPFGYQVEPDTPV